MSDPVEIAARGICLAEFGDQAVHGDGRCCQAGGKDGCCLPAIRPVAQAALLALEQAGYVVVQKPSPQTSREIYELSWLSRQPDPVWGGHLQRGEAISDPVMRNWLDRGLIEAIGTKGYRITPAGRAMLAASSNQDGA